MQISNEVAKNNDLIEGNGYPLFMAEINKIW
jgi:hypothetical protein